MKRKRRELERRWRSTRDVNGYVAFWKSCRVANKSIATSRSNFYNERIRTATNYPRRRWSEIRNILHLTTNRQIRSTRLSNGLATFFVEKLRRVKVAISSRLGNSFEDPLRLNVGHATQMFTNITPLSTDEIYKLIHSMPVMSSPLNKIPTSVIKSCADVFAPLIARLVTLSFRAGNFPVENRHALVTPLLKK